VVDQFRPAGSESEFAGWHPNLNALWRWHQFQNDKSTLLDAYKRNELLSEKRSSVCSGSVPFPLTGLNHPRRSRPHRFSLGFQHSLKLLSSCNLTASATASRFAKKRCSGRAWRLLLHEKLNLRLRESKDWLIVADVGRGPCEVAELQKLLRRPAHLRRLIEADIRRGTQELERIVAARRTSKDANAARFFTHRHALAFR